MSDITEREAQRAITSAADEHCSCGGSPSGYPGECTACKVYHAFRRAVGISKTNDQFGEVAALHRSGHGLINGLRSKAGR